MVSGRELQHILTIVHQWWLSSFQVNGQYALTDDGSRRELLPYCGGAYASKPERQERGLAHRHVLLWLVPTSGRYIELPQIITHRWLIAWEARRERESGAL